MCGLDGGVHGHVCVVLSTSVVFLHKCSFVS